MRWVFGAIEELLPVIVFFVVQAQVSFVAGVVAMTVTLGILLIYALLMKVSVPKFAIVSTIGFFIFALPTILTGDSNYFQLSDTILDGFFAILLLVSWYFGLPLLKKLFESIFAITDKGWNILQLRWGLFFVVLALLNEYFRVMHSTDTWSLFKLVASIAIPLFGCYQFTLSIKERLPGESNWLGLRTKEK